MKSRFTDDVLSVFQQISYFTHSGLLRQEDTNEDDVKDLCKNYELDCTSVVRELNEFRVAYRGVYSLIDVSDPDEHTMTDNKWMKPCKEQLKHPTEAAVAV